MNINNIEKAKERPEDYCSLCREELTEEDKKQKTYTCPMCDRCAGILHHYGSE